MENLKDFLVSKRIPEWLASVFSDAAIDYKKAIENIRDHGQIVLHPRTGSPVPNPYLVIREKALAIIERHEKNISRLVLDEFWRLLGI